jgi:small-conductance mechanosensitive channel
MDSTALTNAIQAIQPAAILRAIVLVVIGLPVVFMASKWVRRVITKGYSAQHGMVVGKVIYYGGSLIVLFTIFHELGFSLAPLLGAAGILGVALGFASQTSVSNIISGVFLVAERPFIVGDLITVGDTTGQVLSIDTLSVKLRTLDNRFVRIPNETIIKSQVINITHFPIRRLELKLGVAYKEDIPKVREVLQDVAFNNPLALQEPEPMVFFSGFGSSSIDLTLAVWTTKEEFLSLKNSIQEEIKDRFDSEGIEIPFPHLSLYAGSATHPFPLQSGAPLPKGEGD